MRVLVNYTNGSERLCFYNKKICLGFELCKFISSEANFDYSKTLVENKNGN